MSFNTPKSDFSFELLILKYRAMCVQLEIITNANSSPTEIMDSLKSITVLFIAYRFLLYHYQPVLNKTQMDICFTIIRLIDITIESITSKQQEANKYNLELLDSFLIPILNTKKNIRLFIQQQST